MEEKKLFLVAFIVLSIIITTTKLPFIGNVVLEQTLNLDLDSTAFAQSSAITGNILLNLNEYISPNEQITFNINSNTYTYTIKQLLELNNYSIEYEETSFTPENEASQKNILFSSATSNYIGFKIPRYSEVNSISFSLSGSESNSQYPSAIKLDFGSEGTTDWYYLGTFADYSTNSIQSEDFDSTQEGTGYIRDSETYYCEFLNFPETKHIQISATYTSVSTKGDIKATILSIPTGNPKVGWSGGSNTCDLPETGNSCEIELDYTIEGKYLVCIYSETQAETEENLYEIPLDTTSETDTGYTCDTQQNSLCISTDYTNFFITVYPATYNNEIKGEIDITEWESFTDAILTAVKYYVGSEPYTGICKESICTVPINITSSSAGNLLFSNLNIEYESSGITQQTSILYDLILPEGNIQAIEAQNLEEGIELTIPLDKLNLSISEIGDYTLEISFIDLSTSTDISIKNSSEIYTPSLLIETATTKLNSYLTENTDEYRILFMLDKTQKIEQVTKELTELENQIGFTEDSELLTEIEKTLENIPWDISASQTYSTNSIINAYDIPSSLGDVEEIYYNQEKISVKATIKSIQITTYNDEISEYILIHREITANEDIEGIIYEIAPTSFSDLYYFSRPKSISGSQGEYSIELSEGEILDLYYLTQESIKLSEFNTIFIETKIEEEITFCGDGICSTGEDCEMDCEEETSIIIYIIPIVLIILVATGLTIFFLRKKGPMDSFLIKSKTKGLTKEQVTSLLKKKGWNQEDIEKQLKKY